MQKFIAIANVSSEIENRTSQSGTAICNFNIAVNRRFKREGEPEADFFRVRAYGKLAETCGKYLSKGKKVCVVGTVQINSYTDKDGNKRHSTEVVADEVEFLSPTNSTTNNANVPF